MNINELRETVDAVESVVSVTGNVVDVVAIRPLYLLAKDVIRLHGVMPEKEIMPRCAGEDREEYIAGYNQAIDDCIKAQAGKEIVK